MATSCAYEFQLRHFRFESADESNFYESQWFRNKYIFLAYRTIQFLYHWGWLIAGWVLAAPDHYYTLSNWSVFFTGLYYLFAFVTSLYGVIARKEYQGPKTDPHLTPGRSDSQEDTLPVLHKLTWLLHVISTVLALYVTPVYWATVAPGQTAFQLRQPIGQHKHTVQLILLLIDFFIVAIPTRWLHLVYGQMIAFLYSIMTVIMHVTQVESAIYSFLDFNKNVGFAVGILIIVTVLAGLVLHTIYFALYHLRAFIYRKTMPGQVSPSEHDNGAATTHDNPAFSE